MSEKKTIHCKTFSIAWGDMDALGHVNHARYFDYFQEARIEWLSNLGLHLSETTGPVVIHVACTYLKPLVYPASVSLFSRLHSLGRSSMMIDHDIYQDDCLMVQGQCKIVWVDYQQNQAVPFPDVIRSIFTS